MQFCEALKIEKGVTAIIGAGGKTSLMLHLAEELRAAGTVILCTTTHIFPPENMPLLLTSDETGIRKILEKRRCVCVASLAEDGKLKASALPVATLRRLADYVLVEADGARQLPLKAHAAHEPPIPPLSQAVIAVLGLSGIGEPIGQVVHRAEIFCQNLGTEPQMPVTPQLAAAHLTLENLHTVLYLNQAEDASRMGYARQIAEKMQCPVCVGSLEKGTIECLR